ncbi:5-keto-L-gluconate epimerase [subsurface metagenome]
MERGIVLFPGDLKRVFSVAEELGFDGIEIRIVHPEEISLSELKDLVNKYKVEVYAISTSGAAIIDELILSSLKKSIRRAAIQRIKKYINFALNFNAVVTIGLIKGWIYSTDKRSQFEDYFTECLEECNKYAAKKGVNLASEPINHLRKICSILF